MLTLPMALFHMFLGSIQKATDQPACNMVIFFSKILIKGMSWLRQMVKNVVFVEFEVCGGSV